MTSWKHLATFVSATLALAAAGCSSDAPVICECGQFGVGIAFPADRVADFDSLTASGPACVGPAAYNGPGVLWVLGTAEGTCHIEIKWKSGAPKFEADSQVKFHTSGCCSGYLGEAVYVPGLDAGTGEGGAGDAGVPDAPLPEAGSNDGEPGASGDAAADVSSSNDAGVDSGAPDAPSADADSGGADSASEAGDGG